VYSLHICFFPGFEGFCFFGLLGEDFSPKLAPFSHFFYMVVNFGGGTDLVVCLEDLFLCHSRGFTGPTVYRADSNQA
jgi:hypothetical protein